MDEIEGFQWDDGNKEKNWIAHGVTGEECEELFVNAPFITDDPEHSQGEPRYRALGETEAGRTLAIFFTIRKRLIRVISARDQNKNERRFYESTKETKNSPI